MDERKKILRARETYTRLIELGSLGFEFGYLEVCWVRSLHESFLKRPDNSGDESQYVHHEFFLAHVCGIRNIRSIESSYRNTATGLWQRYHSLEKGTTQDSSPG